MAISKVSRYLVIDLSVGLIMAQDDKSEDHKIIRIQPLGSMTLI